jgi:hypothetical protein
MDVLTSFFLGAALSWAATFYVLTYDKRAIGRVRGCLSWLDAYQDLRGYRTYSETQGLFSKKELGTDEEVIAYYKWARLCHTSNRKLDSHVLAAQALICVKVLGLSNQHALFALSRCDNLRDLRSKMVEVGEELNADGSLRLDKKAPR